MSVPKTATYKNYPAETRKHNVGGAGKMLAVEAETISDPVDQATYKQLGTSIAAPDLAHDPTALLRAKLVRHARSLYWR